MNALLRESLENHSPTEVISWLKSKTQQEQHDLMHEEMSSAGRDILKGNPVIFLAFDDTPAGDVHVVSALYDPNNHTFTVEIPEDPPDVIKGGERYSRRGGRFPTVLHTIEMFVVASKLEDIFSPPLTEYGASSYPILNFTPRIPDQLIADKDVQDRVIIPLTYQPETANVLFFNKNAKGKDLNPKAIALAHYDTMQNDGAISRVLLRHTMLLEGEVEGGNKTVGLTIIDGPETRNHRLFRTSRLSQWEDPLKSPAYLGISLDPAGRMIRRYSLEGVGPK